MTQYCYHNGKIIPVAQASLPIYDIGILRGYAIFDYARVYHSVPFLLKEHLARFRRSAKRMDLNIPISDQEIAKVINDLLKKNKLQEAGVRLLLTGGPLKNGLSFDPQLGNFYILVEPALVYPDEYYEKGAKLITHDHERVFADVKTVNYLTAVKQQKERIKAKATEILFTHHGTVLECTTSNIFIVKNSKLITPKDGILIGTKRNFIFKLAKKLGYPVEESTVSTKELFSADEVFITSTNRNAMPIVNIDGKKIGKGLVGPITKQFIEEFKNVIEHLK